jgi:5-formyltetrahydrofolate cyclo-ligase
MDTYLLKTQARKRLLSKISSFSPVKLRKKSRKICLRVTQLKEWQEITIVMVFLSMPGEVETDEVMISAEKGVKRLAAPCMVGNDIIFRFFTVSQVHNMPENAFGIKEPLPENESCSPLSMPGEKILVLVPGLGFDRQRNRLGRGKGYYDRYIHSLRIFGISNFLLAGICFEEQVEIELPVSENDQPVDLVVTDLNVIR